VHTAFHDGLGRSVEVGEETLVRVCRARGAPLERAEEAGDALRAVRRDQARRALEPVMVAWDGRMGPVHPSGADPRGAVLTLETGGPVELSTDGETVRAAAPLPPGYHTLAVEGPEGAERCTVIAAPSEAWRPAGGSGGWGVATHLAALRSRRSRSVADVRDFEAMAHWLADRGGDLLTALPLLPTFNAPPAEPSPYAPVSRLFWSELVLELGEAHRPVPAPGRLDVVRADREVRAALAPLPDPGPDGVDRELARYADFRGAQARLGRDWQRWPEGPRHGFLGPEHVDPAEARFHRVAQTLARRQLADLHRTLEERGVRLGLDLAVGAHPDGYDTWSRAHLFAPFMSVGAPPDPGFPSGQDWGFPPVDPDASRREGHAYFAASVAHQARWSGVLRVDHVMALTRLHWIPHGLPLDQGTYVSYPAEELFAVLCLESHRNRCEVVGENLGTVPDEIQEALPRHGIRGMYVALYAAGGGPPRSPRPSEVALVGTHDTPTFAGWVGEVDIGERVRCSLLAPGDEAAEREARRAAVRRLAGALGEDPGDVPAFLDALLGWLGRSEAPRVVPWLEDLWLEPEGVNLPGTRSSERANWQRPMSLLLDDLVTDPEVLRRVGLLDRARRNGSRAAVPAGPDGQEPPGPRTTTG
jgi:4-alpha-glucanotransferase